MRLLPISLLISLAVLGSAWAQGHPPLSKAERIALCDQKVDVPFDPADPPPLHVGPEGEKGKPTRPILLRQVKPEGFLGHRLMGTVIIEAVIDEDGCVRQPKASRDADQLAVATILKAIRKWVFEPSTLDGKPVRVSYALTMSVHPG